MGWVDQNTYPTALRSMHFTTWVISSTLNAMFFLVVTFTIFTHIVSKRLSSVCWTSRKTGKLSRLIFLTTIPLLHIYYTARHNLEILLLPVLFGLFLFPRLLCFSARLFIFGSLQHTSLHIYTLFITQMPPYSTSFLQETRPLWQSMLPHFTTAVFCAVLGTILTHFSLSGQNKQCFLHAFSFTRDRIQHNPTSLKVELTFRAELFECTFQILHLFSWDRKL